MKTRSYLFVLFLTIYNCPAQELFPSSEPASTLPKNLLSARISYQHYQEPLGRSKNWMALRLMYGLTKSLTIIGTVSMSNHHVRTYPGNLFDYFRNHHKRIYPAFPYLFEGFHLYAKQRIFNIDRSKRHFRIALYGEFSKTYAVHDNAEPNLMGDNSGFGGGIIVTKLLNRLAFSFTGGYVHPFIYKDSIITFMSGDAYTMNISAGYRIYPRTYAGYDDVNINFYLELFNRYYTEASMTFRNGPFRNSVFLPDDPYTYNSLIGNHYLEIRPAIQCILSSAFRMDVGTAFPVYKKSYSYYYPMIFVNIQKYFYSRK